jgi:hypothetical protein
MTNFLKAVKENKKREIKALTVRLEGLRRTLLSVIFDRDTLANPPT